MPVPPEESMDRFQGKVAVVTGGASGMGREASLALGYLSAQLHPLGLPRFPLALQVREAGGGIGVGTLCQLVLELVPLGA